MKYLLSLLILLIATQAVAAEEGYSDYSETPTGAEGEIAKLQYGYRLPESWSVWSNTPSGDPFEVHRLSDSLMYAYSESNGRRFWKDANAKELFTWDFGESANITGIYLDVDTYVNYSYTSYEGPPLHVYCDGRQIASVGRHDYGSNYLQELYSSCRYLQVTMDSNTGSGRNATSIVDSWARVVKDEYRYVLSWDQGHGWRFEQPYETVYGNDPQLPSERYVYSYPLIYHIIYDLDGGSFLQEAPSQYRIIDSFPLPLAYKQGYDFLGFYQDEVLLRSIEQGMSGDLYLKAKWQRHPPKIYAPVKTYQQGVEYSAEDLLLNVVAEDALEDLNDQIVVSRIVYGDGHVVDYPAYLDSSLPQELKISYEVTNSDGLTASISQSAFILSKGTLLKKGRIYPRYIKESYADSLEPSSLWRQGDYRFLLADIYERLRNE